MSRALLRGSLRSPPARALMGAAERFERPRPGRLRILTYHRIADVEGFTAQLDLLASRYRLIDAEALLGAIEGRAQLAPRSMMITFDDAYRDFATVAWPRLKERGLPVTLFVATAYPSRPDLVFWWDRLRHAFDRSDRERAVTAHGTFHLTDDRSRRRAYARHRDWLKTLPHDEAMTHVDELCAALGADEERSDVLSWDELRRLAGEGVTLAPHSRTHPLLARVDPERARDEVSGSMEDLRREIGSAPPLFAYPAGSYDPTVVRIVAECGIRAALTTVRGTNRMDRIDPLRLRRVNVGPHGDASTLRARLLESAPMLSGLHRLPDGA